MWLEALQSPLVIQIMNFIPSLRISPPHFSLAFVNREVLPSLQDTVPADQRVQLVLGGDVNELRPLRLPLLVGRSPDHPVRLAPVS